MRLKCKIARWRIDSEEEKILRDKADNGLEARHEYVNFYKKNDTAYYEKGLPMIENTIAEFILGGV